MHKEQTCDHLKSGAFLWSAIFIISPPCKMDHIFVLMAKVTETTLRGTSKYLSFTHKTFMIKFIM